MEPGPLPPHERTWRHPSEIGPRSADPVLSPERGHGLAVAVTTGTLVVVMIAVLVVVTTPRASSHTSAMTATTLPAFAVTTPVAIVRAESTTRPDSSAPRVVPTLLLASLVAIPNEIASAPQLAGHRPRIAERAPSARQAVIVQTDDMTYRCTWAQVATMGFPDGAIVTNLAGALVAYFDDGDIVVAAGRPDD